MVVVQRGTEYREVTEEYGSTYLFTTYLHTPLSTYYVQATGCSSASQGHTDDSDLIEICFCATEGYHYYFQANQTSEII
jgi:hypothetical protein